jgi:hypothetical protein
MTAKKKDIKRKLKNFEKNYLYYHAHGDFCHARYHKNIKVCNCGLKEDWQKIKDLLEKS